MHPTTALMLSKAIEDDHRRELDQRRRYKDPEAPVHIRRRPRLASIFSLPRRMGSAHSKA